MKVFSIRGGVPLIGEVEISGSKNAALPIIFATLITRGVSRLEAVPMIGDTLVALEIIKAFGARVEQDGDALLINTESLDYVEISPEQTGTIRASTYLLGACLGRFSRCKIYEFGGCRFSDRPIDMHLSACEAFGGVRSGNDLIADPLHRADIKFRAVSVGATINALLLAASTDGVSTVSPYAKEPHVISLCEFLASAGASIILGEDKITVKGGVLHGGRAKIIPDMIEAGTYLAAGLVTGGKVTVKNVNPEHLSSFLAALSQMGARVNVLDDSITVSRGEGSYPADIITAEYPGFPTDLQPIAVPALASLCGGKVIDKVWLGRYGYLEVLKSFGLKYSKLPEGVAIYSSDFHPAEVYSTDLRGGMAALLCALGASGESRIGRAEYILRGYEQPVKKLSALGANISPCEE